MVCCRTLPDSELLRTQDLTIAQIFSGVFASAAMVTASITPGGGGCVECESRKYRGHVVYFKDDEADGSGVLGPLY